MKKLLSIILATLMVISFIPVDIEAAKFKDVPDSEWYAPYVNKAATAGIIRGYSDGTFKPDGNISFTEISSLISNLVNVSEADLKIANATYGKELDELLNVVKAQGNPGIDWARPAILKCLYAEVYSPVGLKNAVNAKMLLDTKPKERRPMDRTSVAGFMANALKLDVKEAVSLPYKDTASISVDVHSRIQALIDIGLLSNKGDGTGNFRPNDPINRASIAKMISVAMDYLEKNPAKPITPPEPPKPKTMTIQGSVENVMQSGDQVIVVVNMGSKVQSLYAGFASELMIDGLPALFDKISTNMKGTFTYDPETAKLTKATLTSTEEIIEGKISAIFSTYRYEIEYQKGSILNNKLDVDLRNADIYLDGTRASLTDLDVGYEVKMIKRGDKITKVEAKRGETYSDGNFYQFRYSERDREYYIDLYPTNKNTLESYKLSTNYIYINNRSIDNKDLVKYGDDYRYIGKEAPIKLKFDRNNRVNEINTVFGDVRNGKVSGYLYESPLRNDNRIVLSQNKYSSSYRNETVNLSVGKYTVDVKIDGYLKPASGSRYYDISDLSRDYWVEVTMRDGYVSSINADSKGDKRYTDIPKVYGTIFKVKTSSSIVDVNLDSESKKYFNKYNLECKYNRDTKFYDNGSSIGLMDFENKYYSDLGEGKSVEMIIERDSSNNYIIKRIDIGR